MAPLVGRVSAEEWAMECRGPWNNTAHVAKCDSLLLSVGPFWQERLRALGNAVVPQQGALAFRLLVHTCSGFDACQGAGAFSIALDA